MNTVATGKVKYFNALGDGFLKYEQWLNGLIEAKSHWNHIYKECVIASPNWLIHRKDFDRIGAFNSDTYPEDYELVFRWYEAGIKVVSSSKVTHLWRDHEDRASRTLDIYADNTFLPLKIRFYKRIDWDVDKTVVLWGAGKKGKAVAKALQRENIPFKWLTNNVNKIGRDIYGVVLESADKHGFGSDQVLIAISSPEEQKDVCEQLENLEMRLGSQYYIFV